MGLEFKKEVSIMSKDYIKCDCCGRKIPMGSDVWVYNGYCGVYCSAECFADCYADCLTLDEELIEDNGCEVFNDEQRKKELSHKLEKLIFEKENIEKELEELNLH